MKPRHLPVLVLLALLAPAPLARAAQAAADEQYRFLAGLVDKGLHELAVQEAREFLRDYPQHPQAPLARYRLAGALWELERRDEAAREYDSLARLEAFEFRAECLFRSGEAALARGDEARACSAFEGVLSAKQDYLVGPALFALAEAHFRARRFDEAEARYGALLREHPECAEAPLARRALVWCSFERGDLAATIKGARAFVEREKDPERQDEVRLVWAEALLESDPRAGLEVYRSIRTPAHAEARARGEGFALAALGDHSGAAQAFERLLERAPESRFAAEAALQAGIERLRAGQADLAVERLRALSGSGAEPLYWLAQAQKAAGDARGAIASLQQAQRAKPAGELAGRIQALLGDCYLAEGRPEEALSAYERSGSGQALYAGAVAALNRGDSAGAVRLAQRILEADARGAHAQGARVVLTEALFAAQRYPEAERACAAALESPADEAEATRLHSRRAWCRYLARDLDAAEPRFAELSERAGSSPETEEALAMLVRIRVERGQTAESRAPAERYLERYPRGRFLDQALLALARAGGADSRSRFEEFLERCPESPLRAGVLVELGDLESGAGDPARAARRYAEVLRTAPDTPEAARASYGAAWCAWEQGDPAACERALAGLADNASAPGELREAGLELELWARVRAGRRDEALASWRALLALQGDENRRLGAARTLVTALREAEDFAGARAVLDECANSLEDRAVLSAVLIEHAYLAIDERDLGTATKALALAKKAGAERAGLAEAGFHLGEARSGAGEEEAALALFEESAASDHARTADALYRLGFGRLKRAELEPASRALAQLLERYPSSELAGEARFLLGECAFRAERFEEAARLFGEARANASGELVAKALFRAGLALGELERWSECEGALSELARVAPQFPNLAEAELWRGRALLAQGKTRAARTALERTLAMDQGELAAQARLALARMLEAEGRADDALSEYLKVALLYAHEPSVAEALFRAGGALEALGDRAKAADRYREVCSDHPRSAFAGPARERLGALGQPGRN